MDFFFFADFNKSLVLYKCSLLASIGIHFGEIEADALVKAVVVVGGGADL